jgi:hypothetical protein
MTHRDQPANKAAAIGKYNKLLFVIVRTAREKRAKLSNVLISPFFLHFALLKISRERIWSGLCAAIDRPITRPAAGSMTY